MKILICDDHTIVRDGLKQILQQLEGVTLIKEAANGLDTIELLKSEVFDILLLDISLPDMSGLEVLHTVKLKWPTTNVLILSMHSQGTFAMRALRLGASGYLTKDTAMDELLTAVTKVSEGKKYISPSLEEILASYLDDDTYALKHDLLSSREFVVMIKLARGQSLLEIGKELYISNKTAGTYRSRILAKMEFTKNIELTWYCMENKLI
jgi:DNA-binding NarL/FixJ family response regulator